LIDLLIEYCLTLAKQYFSYICVYSWQEQLQ